MNFPVRAITLDLDDTLWPFAPIGERIEQTLHRWFEQHSPATAQRFPVLAMRELRTRVIADNPQLRHDLSALRKLTIAHALRDSGADPALAEPAHALFYAERNKVDFYPDAMEGLRRIARDLPVVALSNGNADLTVIGIDELFAFQLSARMHGAAKPDPGIFLAACTRLQLAPEQVLHVGDDIHLDMLGAAGAGLRTCWIHRGDKPGDHGIWPQDSAPPDLQFDSMTALADWLDANTRTDTAIGAGSSATATASRR